MRKKLTVAVIGGWLLLAALLTWALQVLPVLDLEAAAKLLVPPVMVGLSVWAVMVFTKPWGRLGVFALALCALATVNMVVYWADMLPRADWLNVGFVLLGLALLAGFAWCVYNTRTYLGEIGRLERQQVFTDRLHSQERRGSGTKEMHMT